MFAAVQSSGCMIVLPCETLPSSGQVASYFWPPPVQKPVRFSPVGSQHSKKRKSGRTIAHTGHLPHDPKKLLPSPSVLQPVLAPGCKLCRCAAAEGSAPYQPGAAATQAGSLLMKPLFVPVRNASWRHR